MPQVGLSASSGAREPAGTDLRHSGVTATSRATLAALVCGGLTACGGATAAGSSSDGPCTSHYLAVASAPTWSELKKAMLHNGRWGRVAAVRTQVRGVDVGGGDQEAVRVVDLLNERGRRLIQADVWRTERGTWRAGVWSQCID